MRKKATNLTLGSGVRAMAAQLQRVRAFTSLTSLVEALIRDEYERRELPAPPAAATETPASENRAQSLGQAAAASLKARRRALAAKSASRTPAGTPGTK